MKPDTCIVAAIDDLMFQSKVRTIAGARGVDVPVRIRPEMALQELEQSDAQEKILIVDLEAAGFDAVEVVRDLKREHPEIKVVGFCHHTETDLVRRSKNARVDVVIARSGFEQLFAKMADAMRTEPPDVV